MNFKHSSTLLAGKTEILCETIIVALRELRSSTNDPVTPSLLSQSLINNGSYLETLTEAARWTGSLQDDSVDIESLIKKLQQFQVDLLSILESAFTQDAGDRAEELCTLAEKSSRIDQSFDLNDQILDFVTDVSGKVTHRQKELFILLAEVTKNLVEVEHLITVSSSNGRKALSNSKAFSGTLERNADEIERVVGAGRSLDEIKSFITSKLQAIKAASKKKLEIEEKFSLQTARERDSLESQIKTLRTQVSKVQRQAETMEKESQIDALTGVANRRGYLKFIREEWKVYVHSKEAFSILMIDVDHFKSINDQFGHWAGDKCLAELARRIQMNLRGTDFLARFGGEEFIAVLPKTERSGALTVAEKLRSHIEQTRFLYRKDRIPLTISIGVSTAQETDQSVRSVLDRVDKGLYEAKRNGRNHVSSA
ncbi:MAG: GGDEF domain-containing protein [Syntrophobacteraceae bacterium]